MAYLTKQLQHAIAKGPAGLGEAERLGLIQASLDLAATFESPVGKMFRICFSVYDATAIRIAIDLKLFDIAVAHDKPISLFELAQKSASDENFILRILRMLIHLGYFTQNSPTTFLPTPIAPTLTSTSPFSAATVHFTHVYPSVAAMPTYFETHGYTSPTDAIDTPLNLGFNFQGTCFELLAQPGNERYAAAFNATMALQRSDADAAWTSSGYPAAEKLGGVDEKRVVFVDVGGGTGHQVEKFRTQFPEIKGKLILEDLPNVVNDATSLPSHISKIGHSFFEPQPEAVKGAKAYYLRTVLHDWPQKQAKVILKHIREVMSEDSVVLVHESILPEIDTSYMDAKLDWHMMSIGALERTEKQWLALAESAWLKVNGIWWEKIGLGKQALMEMVKR